MSQISRERRLRELRQQEMAAARRQDKSQVRAIRKHIAALSKVVRS